MRSVAQGAFGLLLDRVEVALRLAALVARDAERFFHLGFFGAQLVQHRRFAAVHRRDLVAQFLGSALGGRAGLAQLIVFKVALGQQPCLASRAAIPDR